MTSRTVAMAVVLTALLLGCSGSTDRTSRSDNSGSPSSSSSVATTTTTTVAATTTTTISQEEAVKAAYLAYWAMVDRLVQAPDPNDPEIALRVAEPALSDLVADVGTRLANGNRVRPPSPDQNQHRILDASVSGDSATIRDCFVDGRIVVDEGGTVLDDKVVTSKLEAAFERNGGNWKLRSSQVLAEKPGVWTCVA